MPVCKFAPGREVPTPKSLHWQWQLDSVAMVAHGLTRSGRGFYRRGFFERSLSACPFRARSRCQSSASADRRVGIAVTTIRGPHARGPRMLLLDSEAQICQKPRSNLMLLVR